MKLTIVLEREADGRWIAEIPGLPGVMVHGATPAAASAKVKALALHVLADRAEAGAPIPDAFAFAGAPAA